MASVEAVLRSKDGTPQVFTHPAGNGNGCDWSTLVTSLRKTQEETNAALTELVEQEKSQSKGVTNGKEDDLDEEEDDDDDDDDVAAEPDLKKQKR